MAQSKEFVDASHAINDLSHALALLESENTSLRGAVDGLCNDNAKLREIIATLAFCANDEADCDQCPMNGIHCDEVQQCFCNEMADELRKLGVEVTG